MFRDALTHIKIISNKLRFLKNDCLKKREQENETEMKENIEQIKDKRKKK